MGQREEAHPGGSADCLRPRPWVHGRAYGSFDDLARTSWVTDSTDSDRRSIVARALPCPLPSASRLYAGSKIMVSARAKRAPSTPPRYPRRRAARRSRCQAAPELGPSRAQRQRVATLALSGAHFASRRRSHQVPCPLTGDDLLATIGCVSCAGLSRTLVHLGIGERLVMARNLGFRRTPSAGRVGTSQIGIDDRFLPGVLQQCHRWAWR